MEAQIILFASLHRPEVAEIYRPDLSTRSATFETEAPHFGTWFQKFHPHLLWVLMIDKSPKHSAPRLFMLPKIGYREKIVRLVGIWRDTLTDERRSKKLDFHFFLNFLLLSLRLILEPYVFTKKKITQIKTLSMAIIGEDPVGHQLPPACWDDAGWLYRLNFFLVLVLFSTFKVNLNRSKTCFYGISQTVHPLLLCPSSVCKRQGPFQGRC